VIELLPVVEADIVLLAQEDGGRKYPLVRTERSHYRPHIVLGSPDQRKAIVVGRNLVESYLGVEVLHDQELIRPGERARVSMRLAFWPAPEYSKVVPGATFTIREGGHIVGYGTILSRRDPS
jgi:translation elongation factor EF-Tu-like GTPase